MSEDLDDIRAKAEVSVGLVRKLVSGWLPKEPAHEKNKHHSETKRPQALYAADPAQSTRNAQLKRKLIEAGDADDDDEKEHKLRKVASTSKVIQKPKDPMVAYLSASKKKKKSRKGKAEASAVQ
ncbi:uncharacterized protein EV422DRAFT_564975 [Fimicolochytrium jonesii]|uniref:uncharacterized protein n=1 Tax=Fimicolochytrium jonesii TaxID=1396493 RepID=UPI0022FDB887|nr:uncharacterized protein EV422DRAFT_564975 [Fimicolochytrium jonesii]KAI8824278.1 hypothetical protein EV422DRAFT_564975 [Fimicolochytrium jonesii]